MAAALAAAAGLSLGVAARAQDTAEVVAQALGQAAGEEQPFDMDPGAISGKDFAGLRLPLGAVRGPMGFAAKRVFAWSEETGEGTVRRLALSGDVRVKIGLYEFNAAEAVVWFQKIDEPESGANVYQVFVYFDRVNTPTAGAAVSVSADRLPVRAVIDVTGSIEVKSDLFGSGRPGAGLVAEGEAALAKSLRDLFPSGREFNRQLARETDPSIRLREDLARVRRERGGLPGERIMPGTAGAYEPESSGGRLASSGGNVFSRLPDIDSERPIFAKQGVITLACGKLTLVKGRAGEGDSGSAGELGKDENAVVASEGVTFSYVDQRTDRALEMTSQRAVVFLKSGEVGDPTSLKTGDVRGIYLEGDVVATDGRYTLRGPRVYYDVVQNKAVVLDAVFWTYDAARRLPLYLRASAIRQESDSQFKADKATLANTAFFEPQLSIGVGSVTIKRVPASKVESGLTGGGDGSGGPGGGIGSGGGGGERGSTIMDATGVTLRGGGLPFFYWPGYKGDPTTIPLRDLRFENSSASGATIKTTWDVYGLAGLDPVKGLELELLADAYFRRGPGLGGYAKWTEDGPFADSRGEFFAYTVIDDHGTDVLKPGTEREWDGSTRGAIVGENAWKIDETWSLFAEGSYISDETFVDQFFERQGEERREFTTRANLRRTEENTLLILDAKTSLNDFIANEYLSQSQGYTVERLPEISYFRIADDLWGSSPGLLSYSSEYRVGRLGLNFDKVDAKERGFDTSALSQQGFGIEPNQSIADRLRGEGYNEESIYRMDTRHELSSQLAAGPVNVTPFVVGRLTYWDDPFAAYSPQQEDRLRAWGQFGTRFATTIQRVDDSVDSTFFDLHRMRHLIEPNATVSFAGTSMERTNLPVYDEQVEGITNGTLTRLGLDQTWQTQRGGPGRWHSVDVFTLDLGYSFASDDADREYPITRYVGYRPEYSSPGEGFDAEGTWQVSDTYQLVGATQYDEEQAQLTRSNAGLVIQHDPDYSSFVEYRQLDAQESEVANFGARYKMSSKYELAGYVTYDLKVGEWQGVSGEVRRRFASVLLGINVSYNTIDNETSLGFVFQPTGIRGEGRAGGSEGGSRGGGRLGS
jgi:hypothetical protein